MIDATRMQSLGEALRDALIEFKSNTALIEANRRRESERFTYQDFREQALPVARFLEDAGIGAGDRVAIIMQNQSKWLLAAYAVFHRGATLVPLDYKLGKDEQAALLAHAKPKAVVVEYPMFQRFAKGDLDVPNTIVTEAPEGKGLSTTVPDAVRWEEIPTDVQEPTFVQQNRDDVATIVYSSGTGGTPKGCMLTHANYLEQYNSLVSLYPFEHGDRYFSILPTNHAIDFMCGFIGPFLQGTAVIHQRALRPEFLRWTMKRYRITHMALVPLILEAFENNIKEQLDEATPLKRSLFDLLANVNESLTTTRPRQKLSRSLLRPVHEAFGGELKILFCGGAFVDRKRAEFFYKLGIPVAIGYGLTEACTVATVNDLKPFRADSVGRAVDGVTIRIKDADDNGIGEVQIKGPTVMKGYLDEPELTAGSFDGEFLRTGDLGWMDASGHLHLVGRSKNMIVTAGGKNIYPEDIEAVFEGLPCEEMAVFARNYIWPGDKLGQEQLVAVARVEDDKLSDFRRELEQRNRRLPDFKRIEGLLTTKAEFPRTASMKLKRQVLAESIRKDDSRESVEQVNA